MQMIIGRRHRVRTKKAMTTCDTTLVEDEGLENIEICIMENDALENIMCGENNVKYKAIEWWERKDWKMHN